jgi:hypothetical protein
MKLFTRIAAAAVLLSVASFSNSAVVTSGYGVVPSNFVFAPDQPDFTGDGIPNDNLVYNVADFGNAQLLVALGITPRFPNSNQPDTVVPDGNGGFTVGQGTTSSPSGLLGTTWNYSYYIASVGDSLVNLIDSIAISYDVDPSAALNTQSSFAFPASTFISAFGGDPNGNVFQTSQNLLFGYHTDSGFGPNLAAFDAFSAGTFNVSIDVLTTSDSSFSTTANVNVVSAPTIFTISFGAMLFMLIRRMNK